MSISQKNYLVISWHLRDKFKGKKGAKKHIEDFQWTPNPYKCRSETWNKESRKQKKKKIKENHQTKMSDRNTRNKKQWIYRATRKQNKKWKYRVLVYHCFLFLVFLFDIFVWLFSLIFFFFSVFCFLCFMFLVCIYVTWLSWGLHMMTQSLWW